MCSAKEFFEARSSEELSEFLIDAFDRHSHPSDIHLHELAHIGQLQKAILVEFSKHPTNKTLSHEMWAVATISAQFKSASGENAKMPELLGSAVYRNPAFLKAFLHVRETMREQLMPELMRA